MDRSCHIVNSQFRFHDSCCFVDHFSCNWTDDMNTKDFMVFLISDNFYETMCFVRSNRTTITSEAVATDQDIFFTVFLDCLVFSQTNHRNFRVCVNRCWCEVQFSLVVVAVDSILSSNFTHTISSVCQHFSTINVTRCINSWDRSFLVCINLDTTAIQLKVKIFKTSQLRYTSN